MSEQGSDLVVWGWVLLTSGAAALAYFVYRLVWLERYRRPATDQPLARVAGRICGAPGTVVYCVGHDGEPIVSRRFCLRTDTGHTWMIDPSGAVLAVRGYRHRDGFIRGLLAGERITVDGVVTTLHHGERLYRQPGRTVGLEAVRIAGGRWPELRWMRVPAVLAVAALLLSLGRILAAPGPAPLRDELTHQLRVSRPACRVVAPTFSFSKGWQRVEFTDEEAVGLGRLIGDQLVEIPTVEDRLIYRP